MSAKAMPGINFSIFFMIPPSFIFPNQYYNTLFGKKEYDMSIFIKTKQGNDAPTKSQQK